VPGATAAVLRATAAAVPRAAAAAAVPGSISCSNPQPKTRRLG
jgi:hypothetical protein